jgi:hypothetical protein
VTARLDFFEQQRGQKRMYRRASKGKEKKHNSELCIAQLNMHPKPDQNMKFIHPCGPSMLEIEFDSAHLGLQFLGSSNFQNGFTRNVS